MAYTADIQIGVKGANKLRELQDRLEKISREIDLIGARDLFENKAIQSINEYSRALSVAEDNLRDVTLGSTQETAAIREYVQALGDANAARARQNRLIRAQVAAQEAARRTISPGPTGFSAAEFTPALPPSLVRAAEVKQSWNTFFGKAGEVAQDLSRATQTRENAIKQSWNIFFGKAEEVAADLNQLAKTRESQVKQSWARFFGQAQEVAVDLNQQAKVRALNVKSSWARFFREVEEFAEEQTRQTQQARQRTGQGRIGAAAIGAGFPLLFGGGPGAILGGGLGGALGGRQFGFEASVALSALGTVFDRLVGSARNLGNALRAPESALEALQEVGFKVSASTESQVRSLIEAGNRTEAYNLLLQETGVRPEQVNALRDLDNAFDDLQTEFAGLFVTVATELTPAIVVVANLITKLVKSLTGPDVQRAAANLDPEAFEQARGQAIRETSFFGFFGNQEKFEKRLTELSRDIVKKAAPGIKIDPDRSGSGKGDRTKVNTLAEELILQQKIGEEIKAGSNLLDKNAFIAAENVIAAKLVLALKKAEGDEQKEALAFQEARNSMGRLEARRLQQQASLAEKTAREEERAATAAERKAKADARLAQRVQQQDTAAANRLALVEKQLDIANETSELSKIDLEFDLKRTRLQQRYSTLISKALSDQAKENFEKAQKLDLELLSVQRNEKISNHMRDQFDSAMLLNGQLMELIPETAVLKDEFKSLADTMNNEIINGIEGMIDGTKTLGQVASSMLKKVANQMLQMAIMGESGSGGLFGSLLRGIGGIFTVSSFPSSLATSGTNFFDGGFSPIDFFANGGRPPVGRPSVVGERGPELFVPRSAGTIIPNHAMGGANVTVNVDASGSAVQGDGNDAAQLGRAIGLAVQQELVKQKRPGGLLAN